MRRAFLLSLVVALLAVGCKPGQETIRFPARPKRYQTAVSLSPGSTEILASMAFTVTLVGRTAACNYPPGVNRVPVVAQVKPDYEKLKTQNPELVVYEASLYSAQDIAQIKALGFDVFEFKANSVEEFAREVRKFGMVVGKEMEASEYVDKILQERRAGIASAPKPAPTVAMIMAGKGGEHYIAGTASFQADLVRSGGGEPVGPEADRLVPVDAESLIKLNPQMIITMGDPNPLASDPRLASLSAIAKGMVRGLDQDTVSRKGWRVSKAIELTAKAIGNMAGRE